MKVRKKEYDDRLRMWVIVCPSCEKILASNSEKDMLPEFMICACDRNGNKVPAFELFDRDGNTWIRRNKYPRFIGRVTMGALSDIEDIEILDNCTDVMKLASSMRKAGEFLRKRKRKSHER